MPLPLKSSSPSLVMILPSTVARGQNACRIEPQGFFGSVPKWVVPFFPPMNPGADRVNLMSTRLFSLTADLIV